MWGFAPTRHGVRGFAHLTPLAPCLSIYRRRLRHLIAIVSAILKNIRLRRRSRLYYRDRNRNYRDRKRNFSYTQNPTEFTRTALIAQKLYPFHNCFCKKALRALIR